MPAAASAFARPVVTRRKALVSLAGGSTGLLAAACAGSLGQGTNNAGSTPSAAKVALRFMAPAGASGVDEATNAMMPSWNAKAPNIAVQWIDSDNMARDVIAHAAAGDIEDIVTGFMGSQVGQVWLTSGITIALDPYVKSQRVNPKDWYKAVWDAHFIDGKQYSLPWQGQVMGLGLYYSKNSFDEAGVKYPDATWTLDDMIAAAEKLKIVQGSEVKRWGVAPGDALAGERLPAYARNFNAEAFSADQKQFTWGVGPEFLRFLTWNTEMMQKRSGVLYSAGGDPGKDPLMQSVNSYSQGMVQGHVAMVFKGWMGATGIIASALRDSPQAKYGLTFTPKGPTGRRGGWVTSAAASITKLSKAPDQAFQFLLEFAGHEWSVARGLQKTGSTTLNGRPDVYHDLRLQQDPLTPKDVADFKAQSMDFTEKGEDCSYNGGLPWNFQASELYRIEGLTTNKIWTGEAPGSQDMVNELRRQMDQVLQLPRPIAGK